jgi:hypothetical protein
MPQSKFDDMIRDAHKAGRLARAPSSDLRHVSKAVEMLAEVVGDLATVLKGQESSQRS